MARRMRFGTWCKKDPDDETKIVYTFKMKEGDGTVNLRYFTSDDSCSYFFLGRLREAWIESITRVQNDFEDAWHVVLYED